MLGPVRIGLAEARTLARKALLKQDRVKAERGLSSISKSKSDAEVTS